MPVVRLLTVADIARTLELPACVVLVYAHWCGHCKRFKPVLESIAARYDSVPLYCIDEDELKAYKEAAADAKFKHSFIEETHGYPNTYFSVYGSAKAQLVGEVDQAEVVELFEKASAALQRDTAVPCVVTDDEVECFKRANSHGAVIQGATYSEIKLQLPVGGSNTTKCIAQIALRAGQPARVLLF